ncbi:helix-turn-helix domain-containing protein [Pseudomonas aeruginosa]|uniref:helix-turn-helix transcriptional regulator n=1 Tax=Pseudomonas aeruginosa TaxID=287 RepID=UPI001C8E411B
MSLEKLLTVTDLAEILGRSTDTIKNQHSKNPSRLPPVCRIPGAGRLLWRRADVESWLQLHVVQLDLIDSAGPVAKRKPGRPRKSERMTQRGGTYA